MTNNTINICLGHLPFPAQSSQYIDLMVAPQLVKSATRLAIVEDNLFGDIGSSLSEYVQLIWILDHLNQIASGREFIRIFHYRRFSARNKPEVGRQSINQPWSTTINDFEIMNFENDFSRVNNSEIINTPIKLKEGIIGQYASIHILKDLLNFSNFLMDEKILNPHEAARFLNEDHLIPACNIGTFKIDTYKNIFGKIKMASNFLHSDYFTAHTGFQRRSVGFLLERLNSHLILNLIRSAAIPANFGYNIVISNDVEVSRTE